MTEHRYSQVRLSYSALKAFAKSPNHFIQYKERPFDSKAMAFGRAFHCLILEYKKFYDKFAVAPRVDRRTKAGKEKWFKFEESIGDKQAITLQEFDDIMTMKGRYQQNQSAVDLLTGGVTEQWGEAMIHGQHFGGYADFVSDDKVYAVDLKTCRDASPEAFMRDAHNLDYHLQAAIYRHLFGVHRFYWVCVESGSPHNTAVYLQSEDAANKAERRLHMLIDRWKEWDGSPSSYFSGVKALDLPRWA